MLKLLLPIAGAALLAACEAPTVAQAPAATAAVSPPAFAGNWDCDGTVFTFTDQTYQPGSNGPVMRMSEVEDFGGGTFGLSFPDGYAIGLMDVTPSTMTWSSPATGDVFNCRKLG